ncbi:lanthionine synthetase C family protein [Kitasatospora sp. NPDC057940]|uniref:lanthionine synthetase C family protein n=1 Tax=Kitasatospora sp. NPDC057940 TaxID=3346285 RepID=UPI0036DBD8F0
MTENRGKGAVERTAAEAVESVARLLRDPDRAPRVMAAPGNADPYLGVSPWSATSLGDGYPGIALLFARLARQDRSWRPVTHAQLSSAVSRLGGGSAADSLYQGAPALAFAVRTAVAGPGDYAGLLAALDRRVAERVHALLTLERARLATGERGPAMAAYDVIGGLAGLGRYLLACGDGQRPLLVAVLEYLVELSRPLRIGGRTVPGWCVPGPPSPGADARFPDGHLNLGLAHGVPGPLALLALARREGVVVPGMAEAAHRMAQWLLAHRRHDDEGADGPDWPASLTPGHEHRPGGDRPGGVDAPRARAAWCYGTPGVARSLQLAGQAFDEPDWEAAAVRALHAVLDRPRERRGLHDAMLCHGTAGLLQVTARVARDSGDARLLARLGPLAEEVIAHYEPEAAFAFPCPPPPGAVTPGPLPPGAVTPGPLPPGAATPGGERPTWARDRAGFLEGAAGVALALVDHLAGGAEEAGALPWDAALLLA